MKLHDITAEVLREAVRLYLEEAYKEAEVPAAVKSRLQWPDGADLASIAAGEAFETSPGDAPLEWCERVRLRLGNEGYPFMKFGLDHVPDTDEWVLTVDCHDRKLLDAAGDEERAAVADLIDRNARIKSAIERRWTDAGLPTFERFVRRRLKERGTGGGTEGGET
jgi:hypothetical protein